MRRFLTSAVSVLFVLGLTAMAVAQERGPDPAPEIDPGFAATALTLLVGSVLALTSRARR